MQISDNIKTMGESLSGGRIKPISRITIHKESNVLGGQGSEDLIEDYTPAIDEKLLIELTKYTGNDPVIVNIVDP